MSQHSHPHKHPHKGGRNHHHPYSPASTRKRPRSKWAHTHAISNRSPVPYGATPGVAAIWKAVYTWFPHAVNLGIFNCRRIAGSSSWSQHSWGNAWDITSAETVKTQRPSPYLDAIMSYVRSKAFPAPVGTTLYRSANHYNHGHVEPKSRKGGTPPCA